MITINDPAGTAIAFTKAINKYTEHTCRLITKEIRYNFMFEKDLHLPWLDSKGWDEVGDLLKRSDIFHFHMTADEYIELGPFRPVDYIRGKKIVHHHHGHPDFRSNSEKYRLKYKKKRRHNLLISTPDLLKLLPEARWQPNIVPLEDSLYRPTTINDTGNIRICQAPTRKELKNTETFIQATQQLRKRYPTIEPILIENTKHIQCLRIKQSCHIHFDHMQGYFGVSSLESLSQGKPVIAGLDAWNALHIKNFTRTDEFPWVIAKTTDMFREKLKMLVNDSDMRSTIGKRARRFMEKHWTERQGLSVLMDVYQTEEPSMNYDIE
jgi:glycosyltransferase involved in cell wall biosynthesis